MSNIPDEISKDTIELELPTKKPHISFSEVKNWHECAWRHMLLYVNKLDEREETVFTLFGTSIHNANESYLKTRIMNIDQAVASFKESWQNLSFPTLKTDVAVAVDIKHVRKHVRDDFDMPDDWPIYAEPDIDYWVQSIVTILTQIPNFLDSTFPNWTCIEAEEDLYLPIEGDTIKFKGFVDGILEIDAKRGNKRIYYIIDWKTAGPRGWHSNKRRDPYTLMQIVLYKHYWALKHNIPIKQIKYGFVLLKRGSPKRACELFEVSAGPKTIQRAQKTIKNMLSAVRKNLYIRNMHNCMFCKFENTEHCKSSALRDRSL